jgi:hypothetical protein
VLATAFRPRIRHAGVAGACTCRACKKSMKQAAAAHVAVQVPMPVHAPIRADGVRFEVEARGAGPVTSSLTAVTIFPERTRVKKMGQR